MAAALFAGTGEGYGQCSYEAVVVQAPSCGVVGPPDTFPAGMSSDGKVVGTYNICGTAFNEAFVWTPNPGAPGGGTFQTLPRPAGVLSAAASDVNSAGFVVGSHVFESGGTRGFIYNPHTHEFTYLEALDPAINIGTISTLNALNENNVAVGSRRISPPGVSPPVMNAVVWYPFGVDGDDQVVVDLGVLSGPNSSAHRMSECGQVVLGITGPQNNPIGFVYEPPHEPFLLYEAFGMSSSTVFGLIGHGHYAGTGAFIKTGLVRGFILKNGSITDIIDPLPGYLHSAPRDANAIGQILVRSQVPGDKPGIWQNGGHTALDEVSDLVPNLVLTVPRSINNAGQILTRGMLTGRIAAVFVVPVDRPVTDLNGDCSTDVHDLLILLQSWGHCQSSYCPADFTGNGSVGVPDLLILLSQWG